MDPNRPFPSLDDPDAIDQIRRAGAPGVSGQEAEATALVAARDALLAGPWRMVSRVSHETMDEWITVALTAYLAASDPVSVLSRLLESDRERTVRALEGEGFVEVAKVAKWLRHIDRLDEITGAVALRHAGFNPLWDAASAIEREFGRSLLSKAPKEDG